MLIHPQFNPIAIQFGPLAVHWYGLMYLTAFALFWLLAKHQIKQTQYQDWDMKQVDDLLFFGGLGVILGGRLGYVLFYQLGTYLAHPLNIFYVWEGGMSFHGGFLGVLIAMIYFARKYKHSWLTVTDFIAPLVPLGLAAGRIGNFINAELWGRPSNMPWAMIFPHVDLLPRHPSQLYEAGLEGFILFTIIWLFSRQPRPIGTVSALFLIGYGAARFAVEFTREPDGYLGLLWGHLSMGQWLSVPMIVIGLMLFYRRSPNLT